MGFNSGFKGLITSNKFPHVFLTADRLRINTKPKHVATLIKPFVLLTNIIKYFFFLCPNERNYK